MVSRQRSDLLTFIVGNEKPDKIFISFDTKGKKLVISQRVPDETTYAAKNKL
jgi:hypothetical protein